jgi:hypothetical protein
MKYENKTIAVDFDGTCVAHEYPEVGCDIGAARILHDLAYKHNCKIILWTMRSGLQLKDAIVWFKNNDIPLYGIQRNPSQDSWTSSPKAYAHLYIDDAALGAPLIYSTRKNERPYIDWDAVEKILYE